MSQLSKELSYSNQRQTAITNSVAAFNGITSTIQSLIIELTGNNPNTAGATLQTQANAIYKGIGSGSDGWVADRLRYLKAVAPAANTQIIASPKTIFLIVSANDWALPGYGQRGYYSDTLGAGLKLPLTGGWSIVTMVSSTTQGTYLSTYEDMQTYCSTGGIGQLVLSAYYYTGNILYTQDVHLFCPWNTSYEFACKYLWETPAIASTFNRQCNGLYSSFYALTGSSVYQQNQLTFEQQKQQYLTPLV